MVRKPLGQPDGHPRRCLRQLLAGLAERFMPPAIQTARRLISDGSPRYAAQKSLVVDDFAKRLGPSCSNVPANTIEDTLHPPA